VENVILNKFKKYARNVLQNFGNDCTILFETNDLDASNN